MAVKKGLIKNGLILTALVGIIGGSILLVHILNVQAETALQAIEREASTQQALAMVHMDREASIKKVIDIISRYNDSMSDSLKYEIAHEIYLMSQKYPNLNVDFICATITHESAKTWEPTVTSHVGAMGLMQVMPATGAFLAVEEGIPFTSAEDVLYHPILNIRLGSRYLNELVGMYERDGGLAAYNGGPGLARRWLAANRNINVLYKETQKYVPAVLKLYDQFRSEGKL